MEFLSYEHLNESPGVDFYGPAKVFDGEGSTGRLSLLGFEGAWQALVTT